MSRLLGTAGMLILRASLVRGTNGGPSWGAVAAVGGVASVAFVIDVFARRIVGWRGSASLRTDFVLDAKHRR